MIIPFFSRTDNFFMSTTLSLTDLRDGHDACQVVCEIMFFLPHTSMHGIGTKKYRTPTIK